MEKIYKLSFFCLIKREKPRNFLLASESFKTKIVKLLMMFKQSKQWKIKLQTNEAKNVSNDNGRAHTHT